MWSWLGLGAVVLLLAGCYLGGAAAATLDLPRVLGALPGFLAAVLLSRRILRAHG